MDERFDHNNLPIFCKCRYILCNSKHKTKKAQKLNYQENQDQSEYFLIELDPAYHLSFLAIIDCIIY